MMTQAISFWAIRMSTSECQRKTGIFKNLVLLKYGSENKICKNLISWKKNYCIHNSRVGVKYEDGMWLACGLTPHMLGRQLIRFGHGVWAGGWVTERQLTHGASDIFSELSHRLEVGSDWSGLMRTNPWPLMPLEDIWLPGCSELSSLLPPHPPIFTVSASLRPKAEEQLDR